MLRATALVAAPVAEALWVAGPLLQAAGIPLPAGPITACLAELAETGGGLMGTLHRVPWLASADHVVVLRHTGNRHHVELLRVDATGIDVSPGVNLAGERRDTARLTSARPVAGAEVDGRWAMRAMRLGATARCLQATSAAELVRDLSIGHLTERHQFGRPLIGFQVLQHQVAMLVGAVDVLDRAATTAVDEVDNGFPVAAAKVETARLTRQIAAAGHQLHGAIGVTEEYRLGAATTRMWSWRSEFGDERYWREQISMQLRATGWDLWSYLTEPAAAAGTTEERTTQ